MSEDYKRPDPDAILQSIKNEQKENNRNKGKLKIFFGAAAGVGKTYAMLKTARSLSSEGIDIIIGYIETHGRSETEELTETLEKIPRKKIEYRGIIIDEFDIDSVLTRKPQIILIDELAHTNAEGSRHAKRYQDVLELLDNGISVYSTLNIQHLESQADVVEKITGIKVRETLPDSILDIADEVELVDIPAEELLKRLSEGKVYVPEKAGLAAESFFKKGNITALREMALQYTARLVGHELRDYIKEKKIRGAWKSGEKLLVAVSPSPYSEYLIRWTRRIAFNLKVPWIALYIEKQRSLSRTATDLLTKNLNLARELGAEVISTADDDIVNGLIRVATQENITQIVIGKPLRRYISDLFSGGNIVERLLKKSGDIEIHIVTQPDINSGKTGFLARVWIFSKPEGQPKEYITSISAVAGVTLINIFAVNFTGYWTIALLYLLSVVILSLFVSMGPMLLSAALSALLWNFLFIPPRFTFRIARLEDALMFVMYFFIATFLGNLTSKLRSKELALRVRERRISDLYEFSRALGIAFGIDEVISNAAAYIEDFFQSKIAVLLPDESGASLSRPHISSSLDIGADELGIAEWSYKNKKPAGLFTDTLPLKNARYIPLIALGSVVGVLVIQPGPGSVYSLEQQNFLQNLAYQFAVRIERENLSRLNQKALVATESERLYKILLNSITHELRTPLTAIKGSISTIIDPSMDNNTRARKHLLNQTQDATEKLIRFVDSLLDMSRIDSGRLSLNLDWNDISDIIDITLRRLEPHQRRHTITVTCPENIPFIRVDYSLISQAIYCIAHNSLVHTPDETPICIKISRGKELLIIIEDDGPGLPESDMQKIFEKFFRIDKTIEYSGLGLGLSISKGIIELHGGHITAENKQPFGARFTIYLPVEMKEKE